MNNYYFETPLNQKKRIFFGEKIVLFMLLFGTMNFMAKYFYFVLFAFLICICVTNFKFQIPHMMWILVAVSVAFMLFAPSAQDTLSSFLKQLGYPLCFFIGYNLLCRTDKCFDEDVKTLWYTIIALAAGAFIHLCLNMQHNIDSLYRNTVDVWSGTVLNATGQAALCCIGIGCICAIVTSGFKLIHKIIAIAALIVMFFYNLILATRTVILMFLIIEAIALVYLMRNNKNVSSKLGVLVGLIIALAAFIIAYQNNIAGIQTAFEESNFFNRIFGVGGLGLNDSRLNNKLNYIMHLFDHPFGGAHLREKYSYAHDLMLDSWDEAGIFAFVPIVIFVVHSVKTLITSLKNSYLSFETRQLILCVYGVFYLEFMIEPILLGMPWLFGSFCVVDGLLMRLNKKVRLADDIASKNRV